MRYLLKRSLVMLSSEDFNCKFTSCEVSAWDGLVLLKKMTDKMGVFRAIQSWGLPMPGSNRGYEPTQLIEQMIVSICCGAYRFVHLDITRLDKTLARLFGWSGVAEHKSIMHLYFEGSKVSLNMKRLIVGWPEQLQMVMFKSQNGWEEIFRRGPNGFMTFWQITMITQSN